MLKRYISKSLGCIALVLLISLLSNLPLQASSYNYPDFSELIEQVSPSVVKINTKASNTQSLRGKGSSAALTFREFFDQFDRKGTPRGGIGSGFIVSTDGYIVTNYHVIEGMDIISVRLNDRREYRAQLIGSDPRSDLALIKIDKTNLKPLVFSKDNNLKVGHWVIAIGSPFDLDYSASAGIVSAMGRSLGARQNYVPFIQTDVAINPGSSGGPLFNLDGEVVGVNSQIISQSGGFAGLSFAVPATIADGVIEQLKDKGYVSRGWLGVSIQDVNLALSQAFGLEKPQGALITSLQRMGPAHSAGIQLGDIIIEMNGKTIDYSHNLPQVVGSIAPGTEVLATVIRSKKTKKVNILIGELENRESIIRPDKELKKSVINNVLGLSVESAYEDKLSNFQVDNGVRAVSVERHRPAYNAGIRQGDIIVQLGLRTINDADQFEQATSHMPKNKAIPILFYRDDSPVFRTIKVDE